MSVLSFRGRIGRAAFSVGLLSYVILAVLISGVLAALPDGAPKILLGLPVGLGLLYWAFRNIVLRIHDLGYRTWTILALGVPILNFVFVGMLLFLKGDAGRNEYGNDPTDLPILAQLRNPPSERSSDYVKPVALPAEARSGSLNLRGR
jgi:uncharacterized membrane protein YhaH (DUF805 family)